MKPLYPLPLKWHGPLEELISFVATVDNVDIYTVICSGWSYGLVVGGRRGKPLVAWVRDDMTLGLDSDTEKCRGLIPESVINFCKAHHALGS